MNKLDVQQTGGFPLETDTLNFMQEAYKLMQTLGYISGEKTIISGCNSVGGNVSDGIIFLNGEILPFHGGPSTANIIIVEDVATREFENGQVRQVYYDRYATFGTGTQQWAWSDFKRPKNTQELTNLYLTIAPVPVGAIMMWAGTIPDIPDGWALCDGNFDTPDLRSRFVVGYNSAETDYNAVGKTGGAKQVTLTEAQMPEHSHAGTTNSAGSHTHSYQKSIPGRGYQTKSDANPHGDYQTTQTGSGGSHSHSLNIDDAGGGEAHENRPPYYTIAFIQFKGL